MGLQFVDLLSLHTWNNYMGKRITLSEAEAGSVEADAGGAVSITEPRVKFSRGWLTGGTDPADGSVECGDGTAYPLEVTIQQLYAIFYRVRDAKLTSGGFAEDIPYNDPEQLSRHTFSISNVAPPVNLADFQVDAFGAYSYSYRGYCTLLSNDPPTVPAVDPMPDSVVNFGTPYNVLFGSYNTTVKDAFNENAMWEYSTRYDGTFFSFTFPPYTTDIPYGCYDVSAGDSIYAPSPFPYFDLTYSATLPDTFGGGAFRTGFSLLSESYYGAAAAYATTGTSTGYGADGDPADDYITSTGVSCAFNGRVAFIDTAGNGNPFDPLNQMFVGLEFDTIGFDGIWDLRATTNPTTPLHDFRPAEAITTLEFNFGTSGIASAFCNLYLFAYFDPLDIVPFVFEASEWWEYADTNGDPAWDSLTGLPINL